MATTNNNNGNGNGAPLMSSAFGAILHASKCELGLGEGATDENENEKPQSSQVSDFFHSIWQKQPALYHGTKYIATKDISEAAGAIPLLRAFSMTWDDIADLLHHCRQHHATTGTSPPLFFQNGTPITDPYTTYASNPHAAYLDGCSIIINHADLHHPIITQLCDNLQNTFPFLYANAYLTPSSAHAVEAHADDRDVLVVQIMGKKKWKVYKKIPVEYPFDKEQVGKHGNEVDSSVLNGGLCFQNKEVVLCPGDVLYLPRGYVHEATTDDMNTPSFHVTLAIATHDWCMSVLLSETIRKTLDGMTKFRRALPIGPCSDYEDSTSPPPGASYLKQQLDEAMSTIQSKVTSQLLEQNLRAKYRIHNENRQKLQLPMSQQSKKRKSMDESNECVGDNVASCLTLQSTIRVSTPEERSSVSIEEGRLRGLTVREETMPILMNILGKLKSDPALRVIVNDLRDLLVSGDDQSGRTGLSMVCDFTLLSFARCCVELGALAVVQ